VTDHHAAAVSRRALLRAVGGAGALAAAAPALAACGTAGTAASASGTPSPTRKDLSSTEKVVHFDNWPIYIDTDDATKKHPTLELFTKATGITVDYREDINDDEEWFAKISPQLRAGQDIQSDLMVVSDFIVPRYARNGLLQPVDWSKVPNRSNLQPVLENASYDPKRTYSLPWQSGMTLIGYNAKHVDAPLTTFDDLLRPALKGKVLLLTSMPDTMSAVLASMGADPSSFSGDQFDAAVHKLQGIVDSGQVQRFAGQDYISDLAQGRAVASLVWSGDILQLQLDNPDLKWALPTEGAYLWSTNMVIPSSADHRANAEALMDWVYRPDNAARIADWVEYICPVVGAKAIVAKSDPPIAANPLVFPDDAMLAKTYQWKALSADEETRCNKAFNAVVGA
jgi:spermidine/putrescine transport system substrate-binding protein